MPGGDKLARRARSVHKRKGVSMSIPATTPPTPAISNLRIPGAEFIGTAVLFIVGPGSAIIANDVIGF